MTRYIQQVHWKLFRYLSNIKVIPQDYKLLIVIAGKWPETASYTYDVLLWLVCHSGILRLTPQQFQRLLNYITDITWTVIQWPALKRFLCVNSFHLIEEYFNYKYYCTYIYWYLRVLFSYHICLLYSFQCLWCF